MNNEKEAMNELVNEVNVHGHTPSCEKGKSPGCRFNFPKLPSKRTLIAHPPSPDVSEERLSQLEAILKKVKENMKELKDEEIKYNYQNDLDTFLGDLEIDLNDYEEALGTSQKGKVVVLKRTLLERNVNNYNKEFLWAWKANMDLQFCYDSYAVVTYITDYMTKVDAVLTKALKESLNDSKGCNDLDRLNKVKRAYFTNRQVSVAEATYRLTSGMNLKKSNVKSKFVATGYRENRYNFYQKIKNGDNVDSDSDSDHDTDTETETENEENNEAENKTFREKPLKGINIPGRAGKFKKVETVHRKYANRPDELENVCLAQFSTIYENRKKLPLSLMMMVYQMKKEISRYMELTLYYQSLFN